jgi:hypothetical protein
MRHLWSLDEIALLRELYPHAPTKDVAALIGCSTASAYNKAAAIGLKKTAEFFASDAAGRIQRGRTHPAMVSTQFKPGQQPWNTGHKGWQAGGRSAETRFKKGQSPTNTQPIGSLRFVCCKGTPYLERKTSNRPGNNSQRWTTVHRLVWEQAHGPVPKGHIVVFKPGCHTTQVEHITLDKVECISRAENARRNHPRSKHPELGRLVQLKGAITRQVNRIAREAQERAAA